LTNSALVDAHGHGVGSHTAHGPEGYSPKSDSEKSDLEASQNPEDFDHAALAQVLGIAILEFGVVLHRYILEPITPAMSLMPFRPVFSLALPLLLMRISKFFSLLSCSTVSLP
jgi:hypothetical protein